MRRAGCWWHPWDPRGAHPLGMLGAHCHPWDPLVPIPSARWVPTGTRGTPWCLSPWHTGHLLAPMGSPGTHPLGTLGAHWHPWDPMVLVPLACGVPTVTHRTPLVPIPLAGWVPTGTHGTPWCPSLGTPGTQCHPVPPMGPCGTSPLDMWSPGATHGTPQHPFPSPSGHPVSPTPPTPPHWAPDATPMSLCAPPGLSPGWWVGDAGCCDAPPGGCSENSVPTGRCWGTPKSGPCCRHRRWDPSCPPRPNGASRGPASLPSRYGPSGDRVGTGVALGKALVALGWAREVHWGGTGMGMGMEMMGTGMGTGVGTGVALGWAWGQTQWALGWHWDQYGDKHVGQWGGTGIGTGVALGPVWGQTCWALGWHWD